MSIADVGTENFVVSTSMENFITGYTLLKKSTELNSTETWFSVAYWFLSTIFNAAVRVFQRFNLQNKPP